MKYDEAVSNRDLKSKKGEKYKWGISVPIYRATGRNRYIRHTLGKDRGVRMTQKCGAKEWKDCFLSFLFLFYFMFSLLAPWSFILSSWADNQSILPTKRERKWCFLAPSKQSTPLIASWPCRYREGNLEDFIVSRKQRSERIPWKGRAVVTKRVFP